MIELNKEELKKYNTLNEKIYSLCDEILRGLVIIGAEKSYSGLINSIIIKNNYVYIYTNKTSMDNFPTYKHCIPLDFLYNKNGLNRLRKQVKYIEKMSV